MGNLIAYVDAKDHRYFLTWQSVRKELAAIHFHQHQERARQPEQHRRCESGEPHEVVEDKREQNRYFLTWQSVRKELAEIHFHQHQERARQPEQHRRCESGEPHEKDARSSQLRGITLWKTAIELKSEAIKTIPTPEFNPEYDEKPLLPTKMRPNSNARKMARYIRVRLYDGVRQYICMNRVTTNFIWVIELAARFFVKIISGDPAMVS
ncbi:unnamed protein product [Phytophthora lilii]|uniref:Unnamed protein product n=1 Tax=Phytophthora lilii TaxID=2077276 RepID=A0A9W6WRI7_9STRA|nr:unnamed protein product [Phytophthora lilii]